MAKSPSNGNVRVAWILDSAFPVKEFPLAATLNGALNLSPAIAWSDYEIGAGDSADLEDRSLVDLGNAMTRGQASYSATLSMFRDKNNADTTSIYQQAFQAFRVMRTLGWLVVRVNKSAALPFAAGDEISVYKLIADTVADSTSGAETTKFTVTFLPQGALFVHTQVGAAGVITGIASTQAKTLTSGPFQLQPVAGGASIVSRATYVSSAPAVASVSSGGTVSPKSAGTATITVSWGAATASVPMALTLT